MTLVIIPDYIYDEITKKLDAAILEHPEAEKDRAELRAQLVSYLDEYGIIPDFSLVKKK